MIVIGDSTTAGTVYGGRGQNNWAQIVEDRAAEAGIDTRFVVDGKGGSGYVKVGPEGTTFVTETDRLVDESTSAVLFFGSSNDVDAKGDLREAVSTALATVRRRAPDAEIIVVAPAWSRNEQYPARLLENRDIMREVAAQYDAQFVDPLSENWLGDRVGMVGADRVHPTDRAHQVIADHMYPIVKAAIVQR